MEGENELSELAEILAGPEVTGGEGDGGEAEGEPGGGVVGDAVDAEGKPEPEPEKPKEPERPTPGDSWKKLREARKGLDARERELERRAEELEKRAAAAAKAEERASLVERLAQGDVEALEALGIDLDRLVAAQIDREQKRPPRAKAEESELRRRLEELERRLAEERTAAESAAVEREAVARFEGVASKSKILGKMSAERRVQLGGALAMELHQRGERVPPPEKIAELLEERLRQEYLEMRGLIDEEAPPRPASGPATLSRQDSKVRAGTPPPALSDDEEAAEIARMLKGR